MKAFLFFSFLFFSVNISYTQSVLSEDVIRTYPPSVVSQLLDIALKVKLQEAQQMALAEHISKRDIDLLGLIESSVDIDSVKSLYRIKNQEIADFLLPNQRYDLFVADRISNLRKKYTYSQFAIGLRYRDTLALNQSQIQELYILVDTLKKMKNFHYDIHKKSYDTRSYESKVLSDLLTYEQYSLLLTKKNKSKAYGLATSAWNEIEERSIHDNLNKEETILKLMNYYLAKLNNLDRNRHDIIVQKAMDKEIYLVRPIELRILQKARRSAENNTIGVGFNWNN